MVFEVFIIQVVIFTHSLKQYFNSPVSAARFNKLKLMTGYVQINYILGNYISFQVLVPICST